MKDAVCSVKGVCGRHRSWRARLAPLTCAHVHMCMCACMCMHVHAQELEGEVGGLLGAEGEGLKQLAEDGAARGLVLLGEL